MIQHLKIQNFQSHKSTELDFVPGVNVIVGASDSGKTSIIRALRWLMFNKPGGDAFRSHWGGETSVQIHLDELLLYQITRSKDKENLYHLRDAHEDTGQEFKAFGTGVPEPIQEILNINDINLQQQLDSHFLLSSSPGEVAAIFNRIAHLDQIDIAVKSLNGDIRRLTNTIESDKTRRDDLKEELLKFEYLDKAEADLEILEELEQKWDQKIKSKTY